MRNNFSAWQIMPFYKRDCIYKKVFLYYNKIFFIVIRAFCLSETRTLGKEQEPIWATKNNVDLTEGVLNPLMFIYYLLLLWLLNKGIIYHNFSERAFGMVLLL